jgi:hypothetical protein
MGEECDDRCYDFDYHREVYGELGRGILSFVAATANLQKRS